MPPHDLIVAGAGPAGSAAAWRAASAGARVVVVDKAVFPRDKPCGDGLTPRAVRSIEQIGLGNELKRFHRVDTLRVFGAGKVLEFPWPASETFPQYGYVAARTDLDDMMLRHAQVAGAEVLEGTTVLGPVVEDGIVSGVRVRDSSGEREMRASAVIAADGASSAIGRALGMVRSPASPMGVAIRAHFPSSRPEDTAIESHLEVREAGTTLPGYGWVFPMGNGRINVGTGLLSTYPDWRRVNTAHLLAAFIRSLPESWSLPDPAELQREGSVKGWRLPMAFAVWPPWRPGVLMAGDAAGVVNPFNGEGISEAVESGVVGAEVIMQALEGSGPSDLSAYEDRLQDLWGPYYRLGRVFARLIGRPRMMRLAIEAGMHVPPVMSFAFKILSNVYMQQGGTAGDRTVRGMVRLASLIRLG